MKLRDDPALDLYAPDLDRRRDKIRALRARLGHAYYGLHRTEDEWIFREWAPHAKALFFVGDATAWEERPSFQATRLNAHGDWELRLPFAALQHGQHYRLNIHWPGGAGERIPAWCRRVVQDPHSLRFTAQIWEPAVPYMWQHPPVATTAPLIYEAHVGMALEDGRVGTWVEFRDHILPRIVAGGYNTIQLMGVMEHPYYGSFGYHVSSFFAPSSRFGTPEELKSLIDAAHGLGLRVIIDLIHSHAVKNPADGISEFDGTPYQYFHDGPRGYHQAWDSRCFDYTKDAVLHFLLSNCRYWLDEFRLDGFRFDGVTSMLYHDHGLGTCFTSYADYFHPGVDEDALAYVALANDLIHEINPHALTIAEDVSGMPGLGAPTAEGGCGFDFRLAMGVPDLWATLAEKTPDEAWHVEHVFHELTTRRPEEKVISYVESHDQAIVGAKTLIMHLLGDAIYHGMAADQPRSPVIDRGLALHKLARLLTLTTAGHGYLNFMGNEFGHPEWIDFPREGNGWNYHYARRQWSLRDTPHLRYAALAAFDAALLDFVKSAHLLATAPTHVHSHVNDHVLAYRRGAFLIVTNLHPTASYPDYAIPLSDGPWELVLDSDEPRFDGAARLAPRQIFHPMQGAIRLYLPSRSGLILKRAP
jgi:1,4-alpha-glucan branching enzyme